MTPEELAAEQQARDDARAARLQEDRAKQLLGDVGMHRLRTRSSFVKRCVKNWPRLDAQAREATVDRAIAIARELVERKRLAAAARKEEREREPEPEELKAIEAEITNNGRRLEGAEFEEASKMARKNSMTAEQARQHVTQRLRKNPKVKGTELYAEVRELGYGASQQGFYVSVFARAKKALKAEADTAVVDESTAAPAAEPDDVVDEDVTAPTPEKAVVEPEAVASTSASGVTSAQVVNVMTSSPKNADPAAGSGTFLIEFIEARRRDGGTRITAVLDADGDPTTAVTELAARLRRAPAA